MKRLFLALLILLAMVTPSIAAAQQGVSNEQPLFENRVPDGLTVPPIYLPNLFAKDPGLTPIEFFLNFFVDIITLLAGIAAFGFIVFGGFKWVMSGDNPRGVEEGKRMIVGAVIGIIMMSLSYVVVKYIITQSDTLNTNTTQNETKK